MLLCGGRSSRFGADKLLVDVHRGGEALPMAVRAARNAIDGTGAALAVIAPDAKALREALLRAGCEILESGDTARGLGASLAAGVAHTHDAGGWIVALGDMPFIEPATFAAVLARLRAGAVIAAPFHDPSGARGHPVGFAAALRNELLALDGDEGARSVIHRHRRSVVSIPVRDRGIVVDIDTPGDLDAATSS